MTDPHLPRDSMAPTACEQASGPRSALDAREVAIAWGPRSYPPEPPFSPLAASPEYPFNDVPASVRDSSPVADVYGTVREALRLLGLDANRYGSSAWNPLGAFVHPGNTVVVKPNFVREFRDTRPDDGECLITHGAVLRAVLDYALISLGGSGRLIVADAPQNDADFDRIRAITRIDAIRGFYRGRAPIEVELLDLRPECCRKIDGVIVGHKALPGDPAGYVKVDLGARSAFAEIPHLCHLLYGSEYDRDEILRHHHTDVHEYLVSRTVLSADVVISVPKLKTHKKVGLTVNMKNLVGINGNKNWLPHHREGTPAQGGDQFAEDGLGQRIERATVAGFKRLFPRLGPLRGWIAQPVKSVGKRIFGSTESGTIRSGNWYGNDTTWRMVLDLNRILFYASADGSLRAEPVRRFFSIVDGIVGGEGNGPLDPDPRPAGVVLAGANPLGVDAASARIMGFDAQKLPVLARATEPHPLPLARFALADIACRSNDPAYDRPFEGLQGALLRFRPHFGWVGHVEVGSRTQASPRTAESPPDSTASPPRAAGRIVPATHHTMTRSLSRRQLWDRTPRLVKRILTPGLERIPPEVLLGRNFRRWLSFVGRAQSWTAERALRYQTARLREIVVLAYERTPYYRRAFDEAGFDPRRLRSPDDLARLPTIDAQTVCENLSDMCTRSPARGGADYVTTGGTSGRPLAFYIDAARSAFEYAHTITGWRRFGYRLGMPLAVFRGRVVPEGPDGLRHEYDPLFRHHYYSTFHMTEENMRRYLAHVTGLGPCFLHVYPSAVATLARFIRRAGIPAPPNVRGILAESEIVYPEQRRMVEAVFRCRIGASYGHTEKVVAAAECERAPKYHVWPTYGYFELLDDRGSRVRTPGERGEIVGTGFINTVVPFIRYRTGDYATWVGDRCPACGRANTVIEDIRGHRIQEHLVATDGSLISWTALNMHDDTFSGVRQFQFVQDAPGRALLRIVPADGFGDEDRERIVMRLAAKFESRIDMNVELVSAIQLSGAGKAIYVDQRVPGLETEVPVAP